MKEKGHCKQYESLQLHVYLVRRNALRVLCGWLRSMRRHAERTRGVVTVLDSGGTRGVSGCPWVACIQQCSQLEAICTAIFGIVDAVLDARGVKGVSAQPQSSYLWVKEKQY